jgi:small subunit ribosomal protein S6
MRKYEFVLVFSPQVSSENQKKLVNKLKKIIEEAKGKVEKINEWGRRELAYPIRKFTEGTYFLLDCNLPTDVPAELEKKIKLEEEVIRYLLIRKE